MNFSPEDSNSFRNVGIHNLNNELIVMNINASSDNISLHSSSNDKNVDIMSIKTLLNKHQNKELHLSAYDGSTINPIIKINNTHQHVNIMSNLNIGSNLNVTGSVTIGDSGTSSSYPFYVGKSEPFDTFPTNFQNKPDHYRYLNNGSESVLNSDISVAGEATKNISACFEDYIISELGMYVTSDSRIKTNIIDVPDKLALTQLRSIPCRYYEYIDKLSNGNYKDIGFIAQEVKSILPISVGTCSQFIPDIYKVINCTWIRNKNKFLMSSLDLKNVNNIKYRFYVSNNSDINNEKMIEVVGSSNNTFTFDKEYTNVFCYGKEVYDFNILDKDKLFCLNFSATQEIDKIQQEHNTKITLLETENTELKSIIDKLKNSNSFEEFKQTL